MKWVLCIKCWAHSHLWEMLPPPLKLLLGCQTVWKTKDKWFKSKSKLWYNGSSFYVIKMLYVHGKSFRYCLERLLSKTLPGPNQPWGISTDWAKQGKNKNVWLLRDFCLVKKYHCVKYTWHSLLITKW